MAKHLIITGFVQGVGYRASFETQARALQLRGWVRNRRDGSVEALVRGDEAALEKIIGWSRRGPASAVVSEVKVAEASDALAPDDGFDVRPTE